MKSHGAAVMENRAGAPVAEKGRGDARETASDLAGSNPAPVTIAPVDPLTFTDDAPEFPPVVREALATPVDPELVETRATQKDGPEKLLFVRSEEHTSELQSLAYLVCRLLLE